ncbi:MAG TPA: dihydroneopterin aldolase [Trichocoleus sp.]|jgi:dihydroneopterin aldolase
MDCIEINNIRAYGYTGVLSEEQILGQWFSVDVVLWLDLSRAGISDYLGDTQDYRQIVEAIQGLIETARFQLIEKLAETIAQLVLSSCTVKQVKIRLTKLTPPIPNFGGTIAVEITRSISSDI